VRPESATDELLRLVHDLCDNRTLALGLQSGSDAVLRRIGRGPTVAQGVDAVARAARAGFTPKVDFIFGLPGETDADRRATCEVVSHLVDVYGAVVHAHRFTPLPGTPLAGRQAEVLDSATRMFLESLAGRQRLTGGGARLDDDEAAA
jgi:radical SAM superfamily enzyme YgiQ (UPF0313 family)